MEENKVEVGDLKELQRGLPFLIYVPGTLSIERITLRKEADKWATLRFYCKLGGRYVRVKELFLDWFYSGFPKSLMESFVSSYSEFASVRHGDGISFYGKNYKRMNASSTFALGTQIEVEGDSEEDVKLVTSSLRAPYLSKNYEMFPFYKRSFFARKGRPQWFEEERISRMEWSKLPDEFSVQSLDEDSLGRFRTKGTIAEFIAILSEQYFRRVIWIDMADMGSSERYLYYDLRDGGNLFDLTTFNLGHLAYCRENGPAIFQMKEGNMIFTLSFSPLFTRNEVQGLIPKLIDLGKQIENTF